MSPALEQALVGLAASLSTLSIAVAAHWAKKRYDVRRVRSGEMDRRAQGSGNGRVKVDECPASSGHIVVPEEAREYYREGREYMSNSNGWQRENLAILGRIAQSQEATARIQSASFELILAFAEHQQLDIAPAVRKLVERG